MTLYARGDLMAISIPATSGGCGTTHSRPVRDGGPEPLWALECPACEHVLNGGDQPDVLEFSYQRDGDGNLITNGQGRAIQNGIKHVRPRDPNWAVDPTHLPRTGAEKVKELETQTRQRQQQEDLAKQSQNLATFSALMQLPGANPRKLATALGVDLEALGFDDGDDEKPAPPPRKRPTRS